MTMMDLHLIIMLHFTKKLNELAKKKLYVTNTWNFKADLEEFKTFSRFPVYLLLMHGENMVIDHLKHPMKS